MQQQQKKKNEHDVKTKNPSYLAIQFDNYRS